jgi:hypothetical protein
MGHRLLEITSSDLLFETHVEETKDLDAMQANENQDDQACLLANKYAISDFSTAQKISLLMLEFSKQLETSTELVHSTCSLDEWKAYKKAAAGIYVEMFASVLEPLFKKHPSLKPPDWD